MSEATLKPAGRGRWKLAGILDFSSVPALWPALEGLLKASRAAAQKGVATPGVDEVLERLCMLDPVAAARFTG